MKKFTTTLVAVAALILSTGSVTTQQGTTNNVRASATSPTVTVTFINVLTHKAITTASLPRTINRPGNVNIPESVLPAGFSFANIISLGPDGFSVNTGDAETAIVFLTPVHDYQFKLVDTETNQTVKQVTTSLSDQSNTASVNANQIPAGYHFDNLANVRISRSTLNLSSPATIYITKADAHDVYFDDVQTGKTVATGLFSTRDDAIVAPSGYIFPNSQPTLLADYGNGLISVVNGEVHVKVRPNYANKDVTVHLVDTDGNSIGTSAAHLNEQEYLDEATVKLPSGYREYRPMDMQSARTTGKFVMVITKGTPTNSGTNSGSLEGLQDSYADLLGKYNSLLSSAPSTSSDTTTLAKEVSELKSQLAAMQADIAALKAGRSNGVTVKATALTGKAKTLRSANVYNTKLNKTSRKLAKGTNWKVFKVATDGEGHVFYNVGGSQYVSANDVKMSGTSNDTLAFKGVASIKYVPGYSIQVWGKNLTNQAKNANGSRKMLKNGTSWKVFGMTSHNGHVYYNLGGNQYIDASYATLK